MLEVRLLGQFDVRRDGAAIAIPSRAAQSFLAYLLLTAGTIHRREKLAGLFWSDTSDENARKNLRHELWRLRQAIEIKSPRKKTIPYLLIDEISIGFNTESNFWLDVSVVQAPLAKHVSADQLIEMLSHYRGELLPGMYDDWIMLERERVRAVFEQKMARLLELLVEARRWQDILDWGERWISFGQTPEPAYRALMLAHSANGNRAQVAAVYERCVRAMRDDLGVEPSVQTQKLFAQLAKSQIVEQAPRPSIEIIPQAETRKEPTLRHFPIPLTSFIGREREIDQAQKLFAKHRLLTLIGSGGVGKTRLAIELARELASQSADGACWVDLTPLNDASLLPQVVAKALGLLEAPNVPLLDTITNALSQMQIMLIVDNCEHLISACAQLAQRLLNQCAHLKILTTSREALGITGEVTLRVPSLSFPVLGNFSQIQNLHEFESVHLFVDRASAIQPDLVLTPQNAFAVAQICQRLDGIPLAIELAAARVKVLSLEEIAKRLDERFTLLTQGSRTAMPRHQTLRAAIDWSYDLLSAKEKTLLRRLAVFAGGWTLEEAQAICSTDDIPTIEILDLLAHLADKSLVIVLTENSHTRYRLLETIRQYAHEKLATSDELEQLRESHLNFYLQFAEEAEPKIQNLHEPGWMVRVEREHDNFRSALEWALRNNPSAAIRIATALMVFWLSRGHGTEGRHWILDGLAEADKRPKQEGDFGRLQMRTHAKAWQALIWLSANIGDTAHVMVCAEQAVKLARELADEGLLALALTPAALAKIFLGETSEVEELATKGLAAAQKVNHKLAMGLSLVVLSEMLSLTKSDLKTAQQYAEEGIALLKQTDNHWMVAMAILSLGTTAKFLGDYAQARFQFSKCLPMFRGLGDRHRINIISSELAHIERVEGHYQQAEVMYRETLVEWQAVGHWGAIANQLECFAFIAQARGQASRAARLLGTAQVLREQTNMPMSRAEHMEYEREVASLRANSDENELTSAWAEGRAMTLEQAIAFALEIKNE